MLVAHAIALHERIAYLQSLSAEVLNDVRSSYAIQIPALHDVVVCALFGIVLLIIKVMFFLLEAQRFVQNKRYRNAVRSPCRDLAPLQKRDPQWSLFCRGARSLTQEVFTDHLKTVRSRFFHPLESDHLTADNLDLQLL